MSADTIAFDEFEIDPARGELRRAGAPVPVEPQVLDLITHLAANTGRVVSRDEIIEAVWGGRIVSDSAISTRINAARAVLGDDGSTQRLIKTVPRRGYRFEAALRAAMAPSHPLSDKPSVAVLPYQNLSGDPEQAYFSDGITDDIITDLGRYTELFVIARHSSFAYRSRTDSLASIAESLGVQYMVDGSVRRAGNRLRVTARLVDPVAGSELWAERYDCELTDIFEVQDEITKMIVHRLVGEIAREHHRRAAGKDENAATAYDHVLRALEFVWQLQPEPIHRAIAEAEQALALDPGNARAHAVMAWARLHLWNNAHSGNPDGDKAAMHEAARAAVAADDRDPLTHATLAWAFQWGNHSTERALAEHDRAVALNPGSYHYRSLRAFSLTYAGQSERALAELTEAMRVNPHFPVAYQIFCGRALFNLRRYAEALKHLEQVRSTQPKHPNALALVAACYEAAGRHSEAGATTAQVLIASPRFTVSHARRVLPYADAGEKSHFLDHLARAGLPE